MFRQLADEASFVVLLLVEYGPRGLDFSDARKNVAKAGASLDSALLSQLIFCVGMRRIVLNGSTMALGTDSGSRNHFIMKYRR